MLANFETWVVVEGHSKPGGSTRWCNDLPLPVRSTDGTHELLTELATKHPNLHYYSHGKYFASKDDQVNKCISILKSLHKTGYLWQVDVDEHYTLADLLRAEKMLSCSTCNVLAFQFNHYVGDNLIAVGEWGSGHVNRLWKWKGEDFVKHEPAMLKGQTVSLKTDLKFDHYSYYFIQDVQFKEKYYKGYEGITKKWEALQKRNRFPVPICALFPRGHDIGKSRTQIRLFNKRPLRGQKTGVLLRDPDHRHHKTILR